MKKYIITSFIVMSCIADFAFGKNLISSFFANYGKSNSKSKCENILEARKPEIKLVGWKPTPGEGQPEHWPSDGPGRTSKDYETSLAEILAITNVKNPSGFFNKYLANRQELGLANHVLDLFGSGFFIENQNLADTITGLRWGPYDKQYLPPEFDAQQIPTEVLGDIFNPLTWDKLDTTMKVRGISSLSLVTMVPVGGWEHTYFYETLKAEPNILALSFIIENVLLRLDPNGRFYFEINLPLLTGTISEHPQLLALQDKIAAESPFQLVLHSKLSLAGATYRLSGALLPK